MHWVLGLMHVVVVVLTPFARADHLTRLVQPHGLAVSLGQRCPQTVSDTLTHGLVHRLDRQGIRLLLHVLAPELSVTFANSSTCVSGDATRVPRYSNKHAQSSLDSTDDLPSFVRMILSSRFPWVSRQSPHRTNPAFPRTRRLLHTLAPFWFGFEEELCNRWLRQSMPFLQQSRRLKAVCPSAPMANLVKLHAQCLANQGAKTDFTLTFTPVFSIRSERMVLTKPSR